MHAVFKTGRKGAKHSYFFYFKLLQTNCVKLTKTKPLFLQLWLLSAAKKKQKTKNWTTGKEIRVAKAADTTFSNNIYFQGFGA